jgi:peptidyl-prolyl cis-trans isomerase B (cyclophilin B)
LLVISVKMPIFVLKINVKVTYKYRIMKTASIFTVILATFLIVACGNSPSTQQPTTKETTMESTLAFDPSVLGEEPVLDIETSEGVITVKLYKDTPLHRDNFVKLASEGYFDGLIFHRVIKNFMIQAGDPQSRNPQPNAQYGSGGPGYTVPAEILPVHKHKKGALAAARMGDHVNPEKASSGSQFYLVHNANGTPHLDGGYTVFGETIKGLEVIDKIAATPTKPNERPITDILIISIRPSE